MLKNKQIVEGEALVNPQEYQLKTDIYVVSSTGFFPYSLADGCQGGKDEFYPLLHSHMHASYSLATAVLCMDMLTWSHA